MFFPKKKAVMDHSLKLVLLLGAISVCFFVFFSLLFFFAVLVNVVVVLVCVRSCGLVRC